MRQTFYGGRLLKRLFGASKWSFIIGLLICSTGALAEESTAAAPNAKQMLIDQLLTWLPQDAADPAMLQGINDQRFRVPLCPHSFRFSFNDQSQRTIKAQCQASSWQRVVRLKTRKTPQAATKAFGYAYELNQSLPAEHEITRENLVKVAKPHRHIAQNALAKWPAQRVFASRTLRKGQILTTADIYHAQTVAVANQTVPAGFAISADLLSLKSVSYKVPNDALTDLSGLQHLAANRLIHRGSVLRKRDLKKAKLVKRGEEVVLKAKSAHYSIETTATALQDGYFGDQVKLKNINSNQIVRAIVSGANRARVLR